MSELVLLHHNEPMTTSLAIADGTENSHESVIKLVRKYVEDLQNFGPLGFEIQVGRPGRGGEPTEFAYLNEPQATLLITYMRNSEVVRRFKIALVKAFYEMRDRLRGAPSRDEPLTLSHRADIAVAADRTFRSFLRSARTAGLRLPQALRQANARTIERTGVDMLAELAVDPDAVPPPAAATAPPACDPVRDALAAWAEGAEAGRFYTMADILLAACGVSPKDDAYQRIAPRAGVVLRGLGFQHRRARVGGSQTNFWIKG
mgnify:CR=1 FL=1